MNETKPREYLEKGMKAYRAGKNKEAIIWFRRLITEYPESSLADNAHYNLGIIYETMKKYQRALIEYKTILHEYPESDAAMWAPDKIEQLKEVSDEACELFYESQKLYKEGKLDKSKKILEDIIQNYPNSDLIDNAYLSLALILKQKGEKEIARSLILKVLSEYPDTDAAQLIKEVDLLSQF